jgi:hypothetical protein
MARSQRFIFRNMQGVIKIELIGVLVWPPC